MSYIVVDVEADAESPAVGSMVCFGAVLVGDTSKTFYGQTRPIMKGFVPGALAISGFSRQAHEEFPHPKDTMIEFTKWVEEVSIGKPTFISDNPAFDWQWVNYYFHKYIGRNPFGLSARRIGDLYCGLVKDASKNHEWKKKYRRTAHNPVNDAMGNAEALRTIQQIGLKIRF